MIDHPLKDLMQMIDKLTDELGIARNNFLAKKAEKKNLEARLKKEADGKSIAEKEMNADAHEFWLAFEKELNRLQAIYEFKGDKLEVLNKEYQAQYLELKDNSDYLRKRQGA